MRWRIIKTLVHKEALRHLSNRGGIALGLLVLAIALALGGLKSSGMLQSGVGMIRGVQHCYIDYWEDDPLIETLKQRVPESLVRQVHFRNVTQVYGGAGNVIVKYPATGVGAIQVRNVKGVKPIIWCWYPGEDRSVMAPFERWFWRAVRSYYREQVQRELDRVAPEQRGGAELPVMEPEDVWVWRESHERFLSDVEAIKSKVPADAAARISVPDYTFDRSPLDATKALGMRDTVSSAVVLFGVFFICVYLLPSLTCEERETGVLLAQALSPASPLEILAAKLVFYPTAAFVFSGAIGALTTPAVLGRPLFWLTIGVMSFGALGIGMTIACIARTQRSASMTALCYMLVVSMTVLISLQGHLWLFPQLILEFHGPRLLSAAITNTGTLATHLPELGIMVGLAVFWNVLAASMFRKYGWQ